MSAPLNSGSLPLLMDQSTPGRVGSVLPPLDVPAQELPDASLLREDLQLPEVTEPQVVRYFHPSEPAELRDRHPLLSAG